MSESTKDESIEKSDQESDVTPVVEAPEDANSESTQHSTGTRRLRRINKAPEEIRTAKRAEVTKNRSAASAARKRIKKPKDFLGVDLADGRYKVKSQLGKGSMAYVFLAADSRLETDVVVKVPKPEIVATNDFRERFKRETQLLVKFSHPHVVSVLDIGELEELPYVVMQLLSGGSLADQMKTKCNDKGQMSPELLKGWLPGVARALDFCFRKGMVHRDVKPANILFDEDGNAFVADFGLSKVMYGDHVEMNSSETAAGIVLGTPNYISPEIVLAKEYDGRADQYSLGITVYHTLLGRAPMQGNSATATMVNQTQKRLQLLSDIRSDVPEALAKAIHKSIEKNPEHRFESCEAFAEAVLDSFRSPNASASMASPSVASGTSGASAAAQSSNASARRKSPKKKNRSSGSGKRTIPTSNADADWLDIATDSPLPPRKGEARSGKAKKSKKKTKKAAGAVKLFGQDVPVPIAVGGAVVLAAAALFAVISVFSSDSDPVSATAVVDLSDSSSVTQKKDKAKASEAKNAEAVAAAVKQKKNSASNEKTNDKKNNRSGKSKGKNREKAKQTKAVPAVMPNAQPGRNIWKYVTPDQNSSGKNAENGVTVEVRELPDGAAAEADGFQVTVEGKGGTRNWAQLSIKGADFLRDGRIPNAASGLTIADLNRLEIEFDFHIPGSMAVSVFLESGPNNGNWAERSIKIDDTIRDNPFVDGHQVIKLSESDLTDEQRQAFLKSMNSDSERADFALKFGIQGRHRKSIPNDSFIVRNIVMRIR